MLPEALTLLKSIDAKVTAMEANSLAMSEAFVLNDLSKPDYHGHRQDHLARMKAAEIMDGYKRGVTKKIIGWLVVFALGTLASGFMVQVSGHMK
jgi:hypothetical protein